MEHIILSKILQTAKNSPERLAVADSVKTFLSYGELSKKIRLCANLLLKKGIKKGDCVLLQGVAKKEYVVYYFALHMMGAIAVPYAKKMTSEEIAYIAELVEAKAIISENKEIGCLGNWFEIDKIPEEGEVENIILSEIDVADILFTTGTTGKPKGVIMSHKNLYLGAENVACGTEMTEKDVTMIVAPMNHAYAMGGLRAAMLSGAAVVLHESCMFVKEMTEKLEYYACTGFSTVPATIKMLYQYTRGSIERILGKVRYVELGSASLDAEMKKELIERLPNANIYISYGSTEAPRNVYMDLRKWPDKLDTIGKPARNAKVYIVDDIGTRLPKGKKEIGRLVIQGDMVMPGYWRNEKESRDALQKECFLTNDVGYQDEDGFLYLLGRRDDMLNIGGELVSPLEIERVANQCTGVSASACVAIKDEGELLGEKLVLFVECNTDSVSEEMVRSYLEKHMPHDRLPQEIRQIAHMPVNYVGKLDRKQLIELWHSF